MKESKTIEFKEKITKTFLKTVSAFSNFGSGEIYFGIKDDGSIIGISEPYNACLDIENMINDAIKPKPNFSFTVNKSSGVIVLSIEEGLFKPYFYKGKAYKRSDTSTSEVDQIELKRLVLSGENLYFEGLVVGQKSLTFNYLFEQLKSKLNINYPDKDVLKTLGLYNTQMQYNNAALLFSDNNSFPGIDIVRFGQTINDILYRKTISNASILWLLEEVELVFDNFYKAEEIVGMDRREKYLLPKEAFREAVANALIHRTWDVNSSIRIIMYQDKIEISSPGGLPAGMSKEEYINGYISNLRNPIIANVFFRLSIVEMFGTGIRRIKECYHNLKQNPIFDVTENSVVITLPSIFKKFDLSSEESIIFEILSTGMRLATSEIVLKTGFSKYKVIRLLNNLLDKKYIAKDSVGRGTKYHTLL